ncbi:WG repeat-containing protein [bacterium]|nr:WG repeat-containing protein [bacterium]
MILFDRYEIVRAIKSGGMGAVYLAKDLRLGNSTCAVKAMLDAFKGDANEEVILRKFQSESVVLSHLQHPGVPRVRDYFLENSTAYIVMDFIEGENLEQELNEALRQTGKPLGVERVVQATLEILDILVYLHELSPPVIHCDIKPANLIRETAGGKTMLVDFGLARALTDQKTQTVAGTLGYSALEQLRGHAEPRSDLYSLGVTMFHLLTGTAPSFLLVPPIRELLPSLDPRLAVVVDRATRMELGERAGSAREMRQALLDWRERKHQQPSQAELDKIAAETAPATGWAAFKKLLRAAQAGTARSAGVSLEPCPLCQAPVRSDQGKCGQCGHCLDPDSLEIGPAMREAAQLMLSNRGAAMAGLALFGMLQACLTFESKVVSGWGWVLLLQTGVLVTLWMGYMQAVVARRVVSNRPYLPDWGDGLSHLRAGLRVWGLLGLMVGLPLIPLLPFGWMLATMASGQGVDVAYVLAGLAWSVICLGLLVRQGICWPWAWASLASRQHYPTALDTGSYVLQGGALYQGHFLLLAASAAACLGLYWLVHSLWPLAAVVGCWSLIFLADLTGSLYRSHFLRQLPDWPSSFRAIFGPSPALVKLTVGVYRPALFAVLAGAELFALFFGAALPSRDAHRFPMIDWKGRFGYINRSGWLAIENRFEAASFFGEGAPAAAVKESGRWGYVRRNGKWLVEPQFLDARDFSGDGLAAVLKEEGWGYLDAQGQMAIPPKFRLVDDFRHGQAWASSDGREWGLIGKDGDWVEPPNRVNRPLEADEVESTLTPIQQGDKYGYADAQGHQLIAPEYDAASPFAQGLALVRIRNDFGYIDEHGRFVRKTRVNGDPLQIWDRLRPYRMR